MELVINYPFLGNIFAFEDYNTGIDSIVNTFTPLRVFISRPDAISTLESKYNEIKEDEDYFIEKTFLEALRTKIEYLSNNNTSFNSLNQPSGTITYVTTPKGSQVQVEIRGEELSPTRKVQINSYFDNNFPQATRIAEPTTNYNCHSYAWYRQSTSNIYWMNNPTKYFSDGSYSLSSTGSIAVYFTHSNITVSNPVHSAVVSGSNFVSKWGQAGLYRHSPGHSPYNAEAPYIKYFVKN